MNRPRKHAPRAHHLDVWRIVFGHTDDQVDRRELIDAIVAASPQRLEQIRTLIFAPLFRQEASK